MSVAENPDEAFFVLRARAYALAESGRFKRWDEVAHALRKEGFLTPLLMRLNEDKLAVLMIARCRTLARSTRHGDA